MSETKLAPAVLGIDTATWTASVGVVRGGVVLAERTEATRGTHGLALVPLIERTLADAALHSEDLGGIAVSIGPGSFTGLRVGLATAKGLALSLSLPLAAVRTHVALARAAGVRDGLVCPLLDARKGEVYAGLIAFREGISEVVHPEVAVTLDRWLAFVGDRECAFVGDAVDLVRPVARPAWRLLPFDQFHPRGGVVARLGGERIAAGEADDLAALVPLYCRPSEAEINAG